VYPEQFWKYSLAQKQPNIEETNWPTYKPTVNQPPANKPTSQPTNQPTSNQQTNLNQSNKQPTNQEINKQTGLGGLWVETGGDVGISKMTPKRYPSFKHISVRDTSFTPKNTINDTNL